MAARCWGYSGFAEYGLNIVAAFDENNAIIGTSKSGKPIMHLSRLGEACRRDQIKIGIITVPAEQAQSVCDLLISNGILAIWNFAPKHLNVPDAHPRPEREHGCFPRPALQTPQRADEIRKMTQFRKFFLEFPRAMLYNNTVMPVCWNGRRGGLKIRWGNTRVGSSPTTGTTQK